MDKLFILLFILVANIVSILLIYHSLDKNIEKTKRLLYTMIAMGVVYIIVLIVYFFSSIGIDKRIATQAKQTIVFTFVPVNSIIVIPFMLRSFNKRKDREITGEQLNKRAVVMFIIAVVIVVSEFFYFRNIEKGIGRIIEQQEAASNTVNTTVENLSSTENSSYSSQTCRLFFYNSVDGRRYYVDENIHVEENALVSALTSALQDNKYSSDFILLSNQIGVSSATVDAANNALTVKFNDSFEKYMNLDPASSYELIYTLINTYAYNYKVNKVSLYFNNLQYTAAPSADENGWYAPYFDSSISYNKN